MQTYESIHVHSFIGRNVSISKLSRILLIKFFRDVQTNLKIMKTVTNELQSYIKT